MPIRLIAIDIDGTLLDSQGRLPDRNREAIAAARDRGIAVALVTGRSFHFARPVAAQLADGLALIVNNGALIKSGAGETLARRLLRRDVARALLAVTLDFRDGTALIFDRPDGRPVVYDRMDWTQANRRGYYEKNRAFLARVDDLGDALTEDPIQVMFNGGIARMRTLAERLAEPAGAREYAVALTEYPHRDFSLVDVVDRECSKGTALAAWASRLGVPAAEVMAVGDNLNDREMLAFAGVPVVMGNASPALKASGWHVAPSNDEAGLASAILAFALA
ncbi:MAG TPA: Cof-type HAD-IIB family hydrolase [Vicinamibacterales bacterium]|nr:Cof-type HAD-IIB family hydrolase [Vicinamibacterales bacterium]